MNPSNRSVRHLLVLCFGLALIAGLWLWQRSQHNAPHEASPVARKTTVPATSAIAQVQTMPPVAPKTSEPIASVAEALVTEPAIANSADRVDPKPSTTEPSTPPGAPDGTDAVPATASEVQATRRMYAAHAPLRAPEVANPDSTANRAALQTMLQKSLSRTQSKDSSKP
ncbi:MAG: hypothetical protein HZA32_02640 [Opitutae bacterium]|nr:hypothetical protein [Opitutae bacterium]